MAKAKKVLTKRIASSSVELNRWCIEMAMRWPVHSFGYSGMQQGGIYPSPKGEVDADVLGRAAKIKAWVNAA